MAFFKFFQQGRLALVTLVSLIVLAGCGESGVKLYPVQGVVQFPDGKVLRGGTIEFESGKGDDRRLARGVIGPDGTFVLGTRQLDDGAVAGTHRVVVISDYRIGNGTERPGLIPEAVLDPKYRSFRTSGLEQQVQPKANLLVIEVEYATREEPESQADKGGA